MVSKFVYFCPSVLCQSVVIEDLCNPVQLRISLHSCTIVISSTGRQAVQGAAFNQEKN